MTQQLLIVGAGLGGLAAAGAAARAGWQVRSLEQAPALREAGAGLQLGPNATRILHGWGLEYALAQVASFPAQLEVRDAAAGDLLGRLRLGRDIADRWGAPYATLHRADLQALLHRHAMDAGVQLLLGMQLTQVDARPDAVVAHAGPVALEADALLGADGLWSRVRAQLWADGSPAATGHLAWRSLLPQDRLPAAMRTGDVTVWLGPRLHAVAYPVRGGQAFNLVVVVQGEAAGDPADWDQGGTAPDLVRAMGAACTPLADLVAAATHWRLWKLHDRAPVRGAASMARGRVALLGDAAHPMRPYLAQGAAMALEDAQDLGRCLALVNDRIADVPLALQRYALDRWQRNAAVQRRSRRNGVIFHAQGPLRWGRDLAMRVLGERLLDQGWLYR
jgi:salicylate hydroxylase